VGGIQSLTVRRTLRVPGELAADRASRNKECVPLVIETEARVAPGVGRVDLGVRLDNRAKDHRLRLLFPTGRPLAEFEAATTFDIARRHTARPTDTGWVHPAPSTFVQQGFVHANDLTIVAPGLPEAEVTPDGVIAITVVRAVGWLARMDLTTRPQPAGPVVETPGAQCQGDIEAHLALFVGHDPRAARDAELGLRAVPAGDTPLVPPDHTLLLIEPREVALSALKPAEDGAGSILRVLNPTDAAVDARIQLGLRVSGVGAVRLDEAPANGSVVVDGDRVAIIIPAHTLRSLRVC
jgi:mannosylglycerate hydrolase